MTPNDNTPDEDALEEHLDDMTIRALLWEQNALLRGIYDALAEPTNNSTQSDESETYLCNECNDTLSGNEVEGHMKDQHNAPPGIDYLSTPFIEEV
jgi:hypothetical protein